MACNKFPVKFYERVETSHVIFMKVEAFFKKKNFISSTHISTDFFIYI